MPPRSGMTVAHPGADLPGDGGPEEGSLSSLACAMAGVIVLAVGAVAGATLHGIRPRLCRLVDLGTRARA